MDFSSLSNILAGQWGYLGIFAATLISSSTIVLPLPGAVIVFLYGSILNPLLVGLFAALGSSLGELTGYLAGYGGHYIIKKKDKKLANRINSVLRKHNPFFMIILFASLPFIFDLVGIICGLSKYDLKKFYVATLIGNFIKMTTISIAGFYGLSWVLNIFK
ncbi:MAG: VTT domain-containing protein [Candidatus Aenigmarchaeota archaeon]|nr:VTT domain-containing protein [Candidatus Aenigmarchaeota archaeon]